MARNLIRARPAGAVAVAAIDDHAAGQAVLEFQSPTLSLVSAPAPFSARMTIWLLSSLVVATFVVFGAVKVDRLVSTAGVLLAQSPNVIVQPLETAIVRRIYVHEGEVVKKGDLLAELDPTFAASDEKASAAQMASLKAQVDRLKAELADKPYVSDGSQYGELEQLAYLQRHQNFVATMEDYDQKIASLQAKVHQAEADIASLSRQLAKLQSVEDIRKQLEHMQVGSKLNTYQAELDREEGVQRLEDAKQALIGAKRDLDSMVAERDGWKHKWYAVRHVRPDVEEHAAAQAGGDAGADRFRRAQRLARRAGDGAAIGRRADDDGADRCAARSGGDDRRRQFRLRTAGRSGVDQVRHAAVFPLRLRARPCHAGQRGQFHRPDAGAAEPTGDGAQYRVQLAAEQRHRAGVFLPGIRRHRPAQAAASAGEFLAQAGHAVAGGYQGRPADDPGIHVRPRRPLPCPWCAGADMIGRCMAA
jgi:multidrug efflux pump subunit AcrA (membrane-fusion protein)